MIYQVFQATSENPIKNDFVNLCKKYLQTLKIELSFTEIEYLSKSKFKKIVKEKVTTAAFDYLMRVKLKQTKICDINYEKLEMEEYLLDGNKNTRTSKFIFKARSKTLDIKMQRGWKYKDKMCMGCQVKDETGDEILNCEGFGRKSETNKMKYDWFYGQSVNMIEAAKEMIKRLKIRQKLMEESLDE